MMCVVVSAKIRKCLKVSFLVMVAAGVISLSQMKSTFLCLMMSERQGYAEVY